jgi:hypothetical protein
MIGYWLGKYERILLAWNLYEPGIDEIGEFVMNRMGKEVDPKDSSLD